MTQEESAELIIQMRGMFAKSDEDRREEDDDRHEGHVWTALQHRDAGTRRDHLAPGPRVADDGSLRHAPRLSRTADRTRGRRDAPDSAHADRRLEALGECQHLGRLTALLLCGCHVTPEGVRALCRAPFVRQLRGLDLGCRDSWGNHAGRAGLHEAQALGASWIIATPPGGATCRGPGSPASPPGRSSR